jgi:glucose-1-phosphate adenylyltransferase
VFPVRDSLALVLAGGEGRRLSPLVNERSKPAMYFGGRYRLIDLVLSNLVNSGYRQIRVLTQYHATSLIRHLSRAWPLGGGVLDAAIDPVPAGQNIGPFWFRGTADAIWQNLDLLREMRPRDVAIFGSDHVYKMDVSLMLDAHRQRDADLTVATLPVPRAQARSFGCVKVDDRGWVVDFLEKPADPPGMAGNPDMTLVSMGNYVFRTSTLVDELRRDADTAATTHDFGRDVLTSAHKRMRVLAYDFASQLCPGESERSRGYWRDVGTIDAFFDANLDLVSVEPRLNLYNDAWPIRGNQPPSGPCKFVFGDEAEGRVGKAIDSIVGSGSIISGGTLERTVCFYRVRVNSFSHIEESVLFPLVDVGRGAKLRRCIVDKGVHIPPGETIGYDLEADRKRFTVSEQGVVVVSRADFGQRDEFDV